MKYFLIILVLVSIISCRQVLGDKSLGNHVVLIVGDKEQDHAIVYCATDKSCEDGIYLVPSAKGSEYVEDYKSNHDWILARTVKDGKKYFWIINKDFTLGDKDCRNGDCGQYVKTFVNGPLSFEDFEGSLDEFDIGMRLGKE
jgi:hypothetical protein